MNEVGYYLLMCSMSSEMTINSNTCMVDLSVEFGQQVEQLLKLTAKTISQKFPPAFNHDPVTKRSSFILAAGYSPE